MVIRAKKKYSRVRDIWNVGYSKIGYNSQFAILNKLFIIDLIIEDIFCKNLERGELVSFVCSK